ncbi:50 kDa hatching enzyme-like [Watersipora subatra]|uniref:50 kDa hatching enzyme-like n=1 Tax=Watersipora subatra TaxID=2589382 RepID=UPI00355AE129
MMPAHLHCRISCIFFAAVLLNISGAPITPTLNDKAVTRLTPPVQLTKRHTILRQSKSVSSSSPSPAVSPTSSPRQRTAAEIHKLTAWLQEFGYLDDNQSAAAEVRALMLTQAIRKLQRYANIAVTGEVDDATMALLDKPRCGQKDFTPAGPRHKRYILLRRRWERGREIDIQFKNHTRDMTIDDQESIISYVIDQWNSAADARLVFHQDGDQIDFPEINIHHTLYDNRGRPFQPYGVLAYAALPRNGDMYFDDTERWAELHTAQPLTFSYTSVALHEMGHSLGLAHSNDPAAVMYAFYGPNRHVLTPDDIAGAVALFGPSK